MPGYVYVLIIIIGLCVIWGTYFLSLRRGKPPKRQADGDKPSESAKEPEHVPTLMERYAQEQGKWICPRCETINRGERIGCAACGAARPE